MDGLERGGRHGDAGGRCGRGRHSVYRPIECQAHDRSRSDTRQVPVASRDAEVERAGGQPVGDANSIRPHLRGPAEPLSRGGRPRGDGTTPARDARQAVTEPPRDRQRVRSPRQAGRPGGAAGGQAAIAGQRAAESEARSWPRPSAIKVETASRECRALFDGDGAGPAEHAAKAPCLHGPLLLMCKAARGFDLARHRTSHRIAPVDRIDALIKINAPTAKGHPTGLSQSSWCLQCHHAIPNPAVVEVLNRPRTGDGRKDGFSNMPIPSTVRLCEPIPTAN